VLTWEERHAYAADPMIPWLERVTPLDGRMVVEFGCGEGPVSCALAERGAKVLGLDIDEEAVEVARARTKERGVEADFVSGPFETLLSEVRGLASVDVFVLFAVLEHMTIQERLSTLTVARDAVGQDGFIVVCESPNRLLPWDHHTAQLPFFSQLPDELALRYFERSPRDDFKDALRTALTEGDEPAREQLARWGRGVSFHEFELVFDDFPANVVASGYEPELLDIRPTFPDELALARLLRRERRDLPPSFSRYWLDLVIAGRPGLPRRFFEPWSFETSNSHGVALTEFDTLLFGGPDSRLCAYFDSPTDDLILGLHTHAGQPIQLRVLAGELEPMLLDVDTVEPGRTEYVRVPLSRRLESVGLEASEPAHLSFLGYGAER
jgi:SAM-dependent methyltransferase